MYADEIKDKKFLVVPSLAAGILLGFNNFFLSLISELGLKSAYIFSLGAIGLSLSY